MITTQSLRDLCFQLQLQLLARVTGMDQKPPFGQNQVFGTFWLSMSFPQNSPGQDSNCLKLYVKFGF